MPVKIQLHTNCDDALLFWNVDQAIPGCLGFSIERQRKDASGTVTTDIVKNRMGFEADKPKRGEQRPSTEWPLQRLWWTDHQVNLGDTVRYRVAPMVMQAGALTLLASERSAWTPWETLSAGTKDGYAAYFNRGLVISQFMARYLERLRAAQGLKDRRAALKVFKSSLDDHDEPIRLFLSGALRDEMLALLADAKAKSHQVFGALYELEDEELVDALCALGDYCSVVLANGSITAAKGEPREQARLRDQNKVARKRLNEAGVVVHDRFISPGALGHNKFLVVCTASGQPHTVWTGSTNWTGTGLCTQTNNGLLVRHRGFAEEYYAQWDRLMNAGSTFPASLIEENSSPKLVTTKSSKASIWFSRTKGKVDLKALDDEINAAKDGVLFLMFQPGGSGALATIKKLAKSRPELYVRGVVSTLPADAAEDESQVNVDLQADSKTKASLSLKVVQPRGANAYANFAATVARSEFLVRPANGVIGYAIVHSKVIIIDPFTNPVVITGSHNFSGNASTANDENFVIVRGNRELATSYATHIMGVYDHYRWLTVLGRDQSRDDPRLSGYLRTTDAWLGRKLRSASRELTFWC